MTEEELSTFCRTHQIVFEMVEHEAVMNCKEATAAVPLSSGCETKNLFLRDEKGVRQFLLVAAADEQIDIKALASFLGVKRLSFGSPERLLQSLGVTPGAVSIFALVNDPEGRVELLGTPRVVSADALHVHPLRNTATALLPRKSLEQFFRVLKREWRVYQAQGVQDNERGATFMEYALLGCLVAVAAALAVNFLGSETSEIFSRVGSGFTPP